MQLVCSGAGKSNGGSFGPDDKIRPSYEMQMLAEAQVTFWKLI